MKKNNLIIYGVIILVVLLLTGGFIYLRQYTPKYRWIPTLSYKSKQPYGTKHFYTLLETTYGKKRFKPINQPLWKAIPKTEKNSLLFYIGYNAYYDSASMVWMKEFLKNGNNICIASPLIPSELLDGIFGFDTNFTLIEIMTDSVVNPYFISDSSKHYTFHFQFAKKKAPFFWSYFNDSSLMNYSHSWHFKPLAVIDSSRISFIKTTYGKGTLYLFTSPILLSNYYLVTDEGYYFANRFLQELGPVDNFYWNNFSRLPSRAGKQGLSLSGDNPLEFILSNRELRIAWHLLGLGILLFALFRLKRRQKPLPILSPDKNTSVEYARAVGLLYYKSMPHSELAEQMMKIFLSFVRSRYNTNIHDQKEMVIKHIAVHSGIQEQKIKEIFDIRFKIKYNPEPEKSQTIQLHSSLEYFYQNCK